LDFLSRPADCRACSSNRDTSNSRVSYSTHPEASGCLSSGINQSPCVGIDQIEDLMRFPLISSVTSPQVAIVHQVDRGKTVTKPLFVEATRVAVEQKSDSPKLLKTLKMEMNLKKLWRRSGRYRRSSTTEAELEIGQACS
jgi:hypothetical protein